MDSEELGHCCIRCFCLFSLAFGFFILLIFFFILPTNVTVSFCTMKYYDFFLP